MAKKADAVLRAEETFARVHAKLAPLLARAEKTAARVHAKLAPLLARADARWQKLNNDPAFWRRRFMEIAEQRRHRNSVNRRSARLPRGERKPSLVTRGLQCVLRENPDITAGMLTDWLEGQSQTYDDEDIELSLDGDAIVVRDLSRFGKTKSIKKSALSMSLKRARNS